MTAILDHVGFTVADFAASKAFYTAALAPLGVAVIMDFTHEGHQHAGFGKDKPDFWIGTSGTPQTRIHVAFAAQNRAAVDEFYAAAIAAGGKDNGAPGIRAHYHPDYYGAFVFDPDGHNVEAVCHAPQ